ncbi:hypothetical protein L2Y96_12870 [Luteibacter aegosomaticola]|uniref:hypothetical protein n=1 Tax=Luteibacter aegosomaticola TaxID=2911538 RepID=UPI001FF7CD0C|nr:hypothetical protein [Luteibacter aegosomaticola]UPG88313.1 hypothetical protein L2Y96_12870 [Luteibacter aegosomaticola]
MKEHTMTTQPTHTPNDTIQSSTARGARTAHPLLAALIGGVEFGLILVSTIAIFEHFGWF